MNTEKENKMQTPFWEETYKYDDILTFGPEPDASLVELKKLLNTSEVIMNNY